jgi:hypothetical protein
MLLFGSVFLQETEVLEAVTVTWALEEECGAGRASPVCRSF